MAAPKKIDYDRIEPGWRAGLLSLPQLAFDYTAATNVSVSHAAIIKHFKKLGVQRDLKAKVLAKADAMVMQAMVTGKVTLETIAKEKEIIEDSAMFVAEVRLAHRKDIGRGRKLTVSMLQELELQTEGRELLQQLGEIMRTDNDAGIDRKNDLYNKVLSLAGRADTLKKLADSLKVLVGMEREAFGLNIEEPDARDALTQILHGIASANNSGFKPVAIDPEHGQ